VWEGFGGRLHSTRPNVNPTPYSELNQVLAELVSGIEAHLERKLIGAYLQGSFAIGDFDEHSDVDFIVAVESEPSTDEVDALQRMHDELFDCGLEWARHLEGSYFPRSVLREKSEHAQELWYLNNGARVLVRSDHCNTLLVRWVVRNSGVRLAGPPPKFLVDPIAREALRAEIFNTMMEWGGKILAQPAEYYNRFYQGYLVLNYCRMLHDLIRGYPGSKREGAEWAKANLDPSWCDLIDAAWDCRPDPARKVREAPDPQAYSRTLRFLRYVLAETRAHYGTQDPAQLPVADM
jgi:predicted nucleotidyltransferase